MQKVKKIALWSGPRNISTAMMYSFANRKDTKVVDEPLFGYFLNHTNSWRPSRDEVLSSMEQNPSRIIHELSNPACENPVFFMKHMANHLIGLDWSFLNDFKNIVLTRDPKEVLLSYSKHIKDPSMLDLCFQIQHEMVIYLKKNNVKPIVIDSKQVLLNPEKTLQKLCSALSIDFSKSMLSWKKGPIKEDGIWSRYWYENVHNSTGFKKYKPSNSILPKQFQSIYEECLVHYKELLNHQL